MRSLSLGALLLGSVLLATACAGVKPWERDQLARPDMAWDPDPLEATQRSHIHFSREASIGGSDAGGGGCGCN
jgi:hypothetical protein